MPKYYEVVSSFYDDGKVISNITKVFEADEKPNDTFSHKRHCDIYHDYFSSLQAAQAFVEDAKYA